MSNRSSTEEKKKKVPLKMDEIIKMMFQLSDKLTIRMINYLFDKNIPLDAEVKYESTEIHRFTQEGTGIEVIRTDMILSINGERFHLEFQTLNDETMVIRLFEYGFMLSINEIKSKLIHIKEGIKLNFPKQFVIFVEQDDAIPENELTMKVVLWNNEEVEYKVPLMKYWKETVASLVEKDLVPLLPLQLSPEYDYH